MEAETLFSNGIEEVVEEEVQEEESNLVATGTLDDNNANELCELCGKLVHCECPKVSLEDDDDDHGVESDNTNEVRPSARTHQRTGKPLTRKRKRNPNEWKGEKRKQLRQSGQSYVTVRGELQPEKSLQKCKVDHLKCRFKCSQKISDERRTCIHQQHWSLCDQEKRHFYIATTTRKDKVRSRRAENPNRKKQSYSYYFTIDGTDTRICKEFYLKTLDIDEKRIINSHCSKNESGIPMPYRRGKKQHNKFVKAKDFIRKHIESIPKVESHYCRRDTKKEYFSGDLNLQILYEEYTKKCLEGDQQPAKEHMYRTIFNHEYNIEFHQPKKDRCDTCEIFKMNRNPSEEEALMNAAHLTSKSKTREERAKDRLDKTACVICFDMQNVFSLPRGNVSNFFYKRKLNVYHLTGHCSLMKQAYGVLWPETLSGRSGNDIASGLVVILEKVLADHPAVTDLILWSDSCVPQNRNKIMTTAIKLFMHDHPSVKTITQKFCEPGHSEVQEVDNLHSQIETALGNGEIYSPLGLVRILKRCPRNKPLKLQQLRKEDMKDFQSIADKFKFDVIPFTKVKTLQYSALEPMNIKYKTSFSSNDWSEENLQQKLNKTEKLRNKQKNHLDQQNNLFSVPCSIAKVENLSVEKMKDLSSMLAFMPPQDKAYMELLCKKSASKVMSKKSSLDHINQEVGETSTETIELANENTKLARNRRAKIQK